MDQSPNRVDQLGRDRSALGWALALTATFSFSIAPAVSKGAILSGVEVDQLLAARMSLSTLLLGGFVLIFARKQLKIDRRGLLTAMGSGVINGIGLLAFFTALTRLDASVASMIFTLYTLVVMGLLSLRGERLTKRHWLRLALGIFGVYLLIGPSGTVDVVGALLVIVAVFLFASHLVSIQWYLKSYHAWTTTLYVISGITTVSVAWWWIRGANWSNPGSAGWTAIIVLAVVSTFLARLAMFGGVRQLGSAQIALTVPLETLMSVAWSLLFLQERLVAWQWFGGAFILTSMLLAIKRLGFGRRRSRWRISSHV